MRVRSFEKKVGTTTNKIDLATAKQLYTQFYKALAGIKQYQQVEDCLNLTCIMTHRNRTMDQYRIGEVRDIFIEMFCTMTTAVDNPMMNPSRSGGRRAFLMLDKGELEGNFGYWAEFKKGWHIRILGCLRRCRLDLG